MTRSAFTVWLCAPLLGLAVACTSGDGADTTGADEATGATGTTGGAADAEEDGTVGDDMPVATGTDEAGMGPVDGTVTYHRDIRPLLERHCVSCHADGKIAPYSLTDYDEVWPLREAIGAAVDTRVMPPWNPKDGCAEYVGDPSLSASARATIADWVAQDGPEGQAADYVPPPAAPESGISRVDVSLPIPEPYTPSLSPDDYRCFLMDWPQSEVSFITGFEVVPDNLALVHHVITYAIDPSAVPQYEQLDADDPGPGYTCFGGPGGSGGDWAAGRWLGAWAPGSQTSDFPEGTGLRMEPGSKVVVQIHYNVGAEGGGSDQSTVEYKVDPEVEREAFMMPWADPAWLEGGMPIAAGDASAVDNWELDPTLVLSFLTDAIDGFSEFWIYSASHHMHLRGVAAHQVIKRADGTEECLVAIDDYDFNWQTRYRFTEPKPFRPGDTLSLTCQWDNSDNDQAVNWGEGTDDEMCLGVYFIAPPP